MSTHTDKRLYTRKEAARYLGKSIRSIDYLIEDGTLVARKDKQRTKIDVAELDRYADLLPAREPGRTA